MLRVLNFFNPFTFNDARFAYGYDNDVCLANMAFEIFRESVAGGHSTSFQQKLQAHRATHNIRSANDHRVHASDVCAGAVEQVDHTSRRAWTKQRHTLSETTYIERVEAIDIFCRVNALQNFIGSETSREGQLHQDAVDVVVVIQLVDQV